MSLGRSQIAGRARWIGTLKGRTLIVTREVIDCAIEGDPRHHFGLCKVLRLAADLPHALVGRRHARANGLPQRVNNLAINVELKLRERRVTDAHDVAGVREGESPGVKSLE